MLLGAYGLAPTWKFIDTPQVRTTAVDSHSWVDEGVENCRINCLLFSDDVVLLASLQQGFQHELDHFSAACNQAGMKNSTKNTEIGADPGGRAIAP